MPGLTNIPTARIPIRVARGMAYSFSVHYMSADERADYDVTGSNTRLVVRETARRGGAIVLEKNAVNVLPYEEGLVRFDLQPVQTDYAPGVYEYTIGLLSAESYPAAVVEGSFEIAAQQITDWTDENYDGETVQQNIDVLLASDRINVKVQSLAAPKLAIESIEYVDDPGDVGADFVGFYPHQNLRLRLLNSGRPGQDGTDGVDGVDGDPGTDGVQGTLYDKYARDTIDSGRLNDGVLTARFSTSELYVPAGAMLPAIGSPTTPTGNNRVPGWDLPNSAGSHGVGFEFKPHPSWSAFEVIAEGNNEGAGSGSIATAVLLVPLIPGDNVTTGGTTGSTAVVPVAAENIRQTYKARTSVEVEPGATYAVRFLRDPDNAGDNLANTWRLTGLLLRATAFVDPPATIEDPNAFLGRAFTDAHNALIPSGIWFMHNSKPPDTDADDTDFKYYMGNAYSTSQASFIDSANTESEVWYFEWADRCTDNLAYNDKPNPIPSPAIILTDPVGDGPRECRTEFSTIELAMAANRAKVLYMAGADFATYSAPWIAAGGVGGDFVDEVDFRLAPETYCVEPWDRDDLHFISMRDQVLLPENRLVDAPVGMDVQGILLDYEVQDGRNEADTTSLIEDLAGYCQAAGFKLFMYNNPLQPWSPRNGISETNLPDLLDAVDLFSIHLWAGNKNGSIPNSYDVQIAAMGTITPTEWEDKIVLTFELGSDSTGTTLEDAEWVYDKMHEGGTDHPVHLMLWRHGAALGGSQSRLVNRKILMALTGTDVTVIPGDYSEIPDGGDPGPDPDPGPGGGTGGGAAAIDGTMVAILYDEVDGWPVARPDLPDYVIACWINHFTEDYPPLGLPLATDVVLISGPVAT